MKDHVPLRVREWIAQHLFWWPTWELHKPFRRDLPGWTDADVLLLRNRIIVNVSFDLNCEIYKQGGSWEILVWRRR